MTHGIQHSHSTSSIAAAVTSVGPTAGSLSAEEVSIVPAPTPGALLGDDAIYAIAAMVADSAGEDRKAARTLRNAQEVRIETETAKRIEAMRDRAATMRTMALVSGVSGMAAGACQVAGGVSSMNQAAQIQTTGERTTAGVNQETGALCLETDLSSQQTASNQLASARASAIGQLASGTSGCLQSGGGLIAGLLQASADDFEADAQEHAARADRAQRAVEQLTDEMADAKRLQDKVMEFLKEVRASQNSAAQSAIRG